MGTNRTIQLSVPQPCTQNWEKMSVTDKGRFCGSCNKSVIDFTNYSDQQLAAFFERNAANVCGKFRMDQLHKPLHTLQQVPKLSIPPFLISAVLAIGLGNGAYANEKPVTPTYIHAKQNPAKEEQDRTPVLGGDSTRCISGTVIDMKTQETIPGATVMIEETTIATATDINGSFKLNIPDYLLSKTIKIGFYCIGYEPQLLTFAPGSDALTNVIEIKANQQVLMGLQTKVIYESRWRSRLRHLIGKIKNHA